MAKKMAKGRRGKAKARSAKAARPRRSARTTARKSGRKTAAKRRAAKPKRPVRRSAKAVRSAPRAKAARSARKPKRAAAAKKPAPTPKLERVRRRLPDVERGGEERRDERMLAAARSGHDDLASKLRDYTATSPKLTAGDVDAKWEDAYAIGDEAPGGDNPTPDQDRVDDIGKALGVQYQDNEELQGGDEILERDEKRWELDPASSDDWPHDKDKD